MADIDISELVAKMVGAAEKEISDRWPDAEAYAESEFKKIGDSIVLIQKEVAAGRMTEAHARLHLTIQKNAARMALLAIDGLGILTVEAAINGALAIVKETVNTAVDFPLL
jgi:hypothetical protein